MNIKRCRQYSVFLENRVGALAEVCTIIADRKINLHAICAIDTIEESILRIVPEAGSEIGRLLDQAGFRSIESEVLLVELVNQPGATGDLATRLSQAGININYVYASVHPQCQQATLVLRVGDIDQALTVLQGEGA